MSEVKVSAELMPSESSEGGSVPGLSPLFIKDRLPPVYSLDVLLSLFGTSLLFYVQF